MAGQRETATLQIDSSDFAHWNVDICGPDWGTEVRYDFVRLERFISSGMEKPTVSFLFRGLVWFFGDLLSGAEARIFRVSWRFADNLVVKAGSPKTVYDFIKDAHEAGVKFYCCSPNLDLFDMTEADLVPECAGIVGGAKVIEEVMEDDQARVLTY